MRVSGRYGGILLVVALAALVPTVVHNYLGRRVAADARVSGLDVNVPGMTAFPTRRGASWFVSTFGTGEAFEREYRDPAGTAVKLTVIQSFDPKQLYHHPENVVAYGQSLRPAGVAPLDGVAGVPVHWLSQSEKQAAAVQGAYVLWYGGEFVNDPYRAQLRQAPTVLFRGGVPMTLLFVAGPPASPGTGGPVERVLAAAVAAWRAQVNAGGQTGAEIGGPAAAGASAPGSNQAGSNQAGASDAAGSPGR
jgi:hypothetical protein